MFKEIYLSTIRGWASKTFKEPHQWLLINLVFLPLALPLVTIGPACAVACWLAKRYSGEYRISLWRDLREALRACFWRALPMGLLDLCLSVTFLLSVLSLLGGELSAAMAFCHAAFLVLDGVYLLSGFYRYPVLVFNTQLSGLRALGVGVLLTFNNLPVLLMVASVDALVLIFSLFTGFGLAMILPGVTAFMGVYLYRCSLVKYQAHRTSDGAPAPAVQPPALHTR